MEKQAINPWKWQDQFGFVQANLVGGQKVLYCSGQTSVDENGAVVHQGDMAAQMNKALDNVEAVIKQAGMTLDNVVHLRVYVTDLDAAFAAFPAVGARLGAIGAAQTLLGISRLAFPGLMVEIEATAVA
jgi:enamine deaminase RidA (YjgF/YER057c/UK114 family)